VTAYLKDMLRTGELNPGDRIVDAELQEALNVSPITTKKALGILVSEGLIYRVPGRGTFVADRPNLQREINAREGRSIVFLFPMTENGVGLLARTDHLGELLVGIARGCRTHGYSLMVQDTENQPDTESAAIRAHKDHLADGLILYPTVYERFSDELMRVKLENVPMVLVDQFWPQVDTNFVVTDHRQGVYDATEHLINKGHEHIAVVTDYEPQVLNVKARIEGYEQCLADHGFPVYKDRIHDASAGGRYSLVADDDARIRGLCAFVAAHHEVTAYISSDVRMIAALRRSELHIGADVSLILVDDSLMAQRYPVPITVLRQQNRLVGEKAVAILATGGAPVQRHFVVPELVVRDSVVDLTV
jgi:DNA-binding LacI/PurR family transcriptional regulator